MNYNEDIKLLPNVGHERSSVISQEVEILTYTTVKISQYVFFFFFCREYQMGL